MKALALAALPLGLVAASAFLAALAAAPFGWEVVALPLGMALIGVPLAVKQARQWTDMVDGYLGLPTIDRVDAVSISLAVGGLLVTLWLFVQVSTGGDLVMPSHYEALAAASTAIAIPIAEEVAFRVVLYCACRVAGLSVWMSLTVQTAMFSLLHSAVGFPALAVYMVLGMALGLWVLATGSVWPSVLLHAVWNTVEMGKLVWTGATLAVDGPGGPPSANSTAIALAAAAWLLLLGGLLFRRRRGAGLQPSMA